MSSLSLNKPIDIGKGIKISSLIWIIAIVFFFILALISNLVDSRLGSNFSQFKWIDYILRFLLFGIIIVGVIAFISMILFAINRTTKQIRNNGFHFNPWIISTILLLIVVSFLIGKNSIDKAKDSSTTVIPTQSVSNVVPANNNYQPAVVIPTNQTVQTKVPVSFSNGSAYSCDQAAVQALRDADSSYQRAEQEKGQCSSKYSQQDMSRLKSCENTCNSMYSATTQSSQRSSCIDGCYNEYKSFVKNSGSICDTYSSSQKANLDRLIGIYCTNK